MSASETLVGVLRALKDAFERSDVRFMVIGGFAVIARGIARATADIDAVAWGSDVDLDAVLVLQRRLWGWVSASSVVAGAGLVLSASSPVRPAQQGCEAVGGGEDGGGQQAADLVAGQRDLLAGCGSPFLASSARVTAR